MSICRASLFIMYVYNTYVHLQHYVRNALDARSTLLLDLFEMTTIRLYQDDQGDARTYDARLRMLSCTYDDAMTLRTDHLM